MADLSTARKVGIVARVAARQIGRSRRLGALWQASRDVAEQFGRVLRQLWLEVTGFVFLVIAAIGGTALVREYGLYQAGKTTFGRVILALCFTVVFAWFGVSSFWRVRKRG
ncbi:MAG TPA: hypothetical protein VMT28_05055 [Terriglobales bacterium]|nr:hypothetical protein [Terriglobales bacterium]